MHIKLKGMEHRVYSVLTHTIEPQIVSKGQNSFFTGSSHVAYQIKGKGTKSTMQAHILPFHTQPNPTWGQKHKTFFAESSHVAYQFNGNKAKSTMQIHILSSYTHTPDPWGRVKRSKHFFY